MQDTDSRAIIESTAMLNFLKASIHHETYAIPPPILLPTKNVLRLLSDSLSTSTRTASTPSRS